MKTALTPACIAVAMLVCGCPQPIAHPPHNMAQYAEIRRTHPHEYARSTIMLVNIQRVLDPDLPAPHRMESLDLIANLVGPEGKLPGELSAALDQPNCPPDLQKRIRGGTGAVVSVAGVPVNMVAGTGPPIDLANLSQAATGPKRTAALKWLIDNPKPSMLGDVVKLWATEKPDGQDETLFRQVVARLAGAPWPDALLGSLNAVKFPARGSALSVLAARGGEIKLLRRIRQMTARTPSARAMRAFAEKFSHVPANGGELLTAVALYNADPKSLDAPARLARQWARQYNYKFNVRDFHLLSKLADDPIRNKIGRDELVKQILTRIGRRRHVTGGGGPFAKQAARLTLPDLWNIALLDEMLQRKRVALALRILADRLRAELTSPRSGLVFYQDGRASAKLYPQTVDSVRGDRDHVPQRGLQRAGLTALCQFHTRFEAVYNGDRAPASRREVAIAAQANFYGLILASIDSGTFSAFYYNPDGAVVSLGVFAFGK